MSDPPPIWVCLLNRQRVLLEIMRYMQLRLAMLVGVPPQSIGAAIKRDEQGRWVPVLADASGKLPLRKFAKARRQVLGRGHKEISMRLAGLSEVRGGA